MSDLGPEVEVAIQATMKVSIQPHHEYSNYIGCPGFPDISDEEVRKIDPVELAERMVKFENVHGQQSLGSAYNEDWIVDSITGEIVG